MSTIRHEVGRARAALDALEQRGEEIADEWQYIVDLHAAWADRLNGVAEARGAEEASPGAIAALDAAIAEADSIADPHRAIDWLSTFPQVALAALGETD
ncbi:MAG TPA: hypothetical protein VGC90_04425 [Candidatus Limnocylindrales bacterium]